MQTLRFYTRRIFAVVFIIFFTFLIFLATRKWYDEEVNERYLQQKHVRLLNTPVTSRQQMPIIGLGDQMSFQPQPPPALNQPYQAYRSLNITRHMDTNVVNHMREYLRRINFDKLVPLECKRKMDLAQHFFQAENRNVSMGDSWERFYAQIGSCQLYTNDKVVDDLLYDLSHLPIKHVEIMEGGTQIEDTLRGLPFLYVLVIQTEFQVKLILTFENNKQAVLKPMRFGRDYETDPNHFYFGDFERHNAEIATFHLDRLLGFRRAVPTVGRVFNMTQELRDKADKRLQRTFFLSPVKNVCFVSKCDYYCDTTHAICGSPDLKEASVQTFLPDDSSVPRKHNRSPYRRTYSKKNQIAEWQENMQYCTEQVKSRKVYSHGRRLLDLIDLHIMDYLIINQDRHHYETFSVFPSDIQSYALHLDNGRAFGRTKVDDDDILLPLRQCCIIRPSTLAKLWLFYTGSKSLTEALHESLSNDPIQPVLAFKHYSAMERRLNKIMKYILECMNRYSLEHIEKMVQPEYHNPSVPLPQSNEDVNATESEDTVDKPAAQEGGAIPMPNNNENNVVGGVDIGAMADGGLLPPLKQRLG